MDQLHKHEFIFLFSKCSFKRSTSTFLFMCRSVSRGLVIGSLSKHPFISFVPYPFCYNISYSFQYITSYIPYFSQWQCGHTIYDLGIHLLHCPCKNEHTIAHDTLQDTVVTIMSESGAHVQKKVSHLSPHHTQKQMDIVIIRNDF